MNKHGAGKPRKQRPSDFRRTGKGELTQMGNTGIPAFTYKEGKDVNTPDGRGKVIGRFVHPSSGCYTCCYDVHINGKGDLIYFERELLAVVQ